MPEQPIDVRTSNFDEVSLGYTEEMAVSEAMRCLNCRKHPCMDGCPAHNRIPDFIAQVAMGDFEAAYQILAETTSLPAVCGRVCDQANQCEGNCVRGHKGEPVGIGRIEYFVADWHRAHAEKEEKPESNGTKVAVIGAGPAGLACADVLSGKGYDVTIYDSLDLAGGVVAYGIPEFVCPQSITDAIASDLEEKGVKFVGGTTVGKDTKIADMMSKDGYKAVFIGTGAETCTKMNVPGEDIPGVVNANEYLKKMSLDKIYEKDSDDPIKTAKKVAVIGGGNTAIDCARSAIRMGAETHIVYRRSLKEMPARAEEVVRAMDEGVDIQYLACPVEYIAGADGKVAKMNCVKMELGEPDESGRRRPIPIEGSNYDIDVDLVVLALGYTMDELITGTTDNLATDKWGNIPTGENGDTNLPGIFAGGDVVTGAKTVVHAMKAGRVAADGIDEFLSK
ncbi:MAG: NADPH-dependent glutamate synthase [Anaerovoracaceae bacterium]